MPWVWEKCPMLSAFCSVSQEARGRMHLAVQQESRGTLVGGNTVYIGNPDHIVGY